MKRLFLVVLLGFFTVGVAAMFAQVRATTIGPKVGLYFDGSHPLVGANADFPLTPDLDLEPGVELVFGVPNTTVLVIDANGRYSFNVAGSAVRPYALGGLGISMSFVSIGGASSSTTDYRLNLGGGAVFNSRDRIQFWAGLKLFLLAKSGSDISLQGGANFAL